ncbi:MAG: NAD-dependent epimerase/dehydratase family protein [Rhodospirillales bacterium]|jgi:nucleoside-diphosphate-sugar epimerase
MTGTVLVTGANGFVGQALCRHLGKQGWRVLAALRPGRPAPPDCESRPAPDLEPDADWGPALDGATHVVHAAARVHQMGESGELAEKAHQRANYRGTLALAEQAAAAGVKRFVFLSTAKVMGEHNPPGHPFSDADAPAPEDAYARAKRAAELSLLALPGLDCAILRPPLVYGPGAGANLGSLMRLILKAIPLPFGLVANRRSLIGLSNLAAGVESLLNHPDATSKVFLIKDLDVSTGELIQLLAKALGRPARLVPVPVPLLKLGAALTGKQDMAERILGSLEIDDSALRRGLGWQPPADPHHDLKAMANAFIQGL